MDQQYRVYLVPQVYYIAWHPYVRNANAADAYRWNDLTYGSSAVTYMWKMPR